MKKRPKNRLVVRYAIVCGLIFLGTPGDHGYGQRKSQGGRELTPGMMIKESSLDYRLWETFVLVRRANDGEAPAQHELGIRYLQGKGFQADTQKAALWFEKAARQNFDLAHFNMGILMLNGWGTPWNPFAAYGHFEGASRKGMPEADFILGLIHTEDLIVAQDWQKAYALVRRAADAGFEPAKKALVQFQRRGIITGNEMEHEDTSGGQTRPIFIDFDVDTNSTVERTLLNDLAREGSPELQKVLGVEPSTVSSDTTAYAMIRSAAASGSPEAHALLGRFLEKGVGGKPNLIGASARYLVALRNESDRALELLWNLAQQPGYADELERQAKAGDPTARFVWAGLVAAGIDRRLSGEQALRLLQSSAGQKHAEAILELGLCYHSGRWVAQDRTMALKLWEEAAAMGNSEALVRLHAVKLFAQKPEVAPSTISFFRQFAGNGSLLAQVALGYCYEQGLGVGRDAGIASRLYRNAAQRGSQSAYQALKRMHDEIRPEGNEWKVR